MGSLPLAAASAINSLFAQRDTGEKAERRASDLPVIGSLFQREYGGADTDVVYGLAKEAVTAADTYRSMLKEGRKEEAADYLEQNHAQIFAASAGRKYENVMGTLRTRADIIQSNKTLSAPDKRAKLDAIDALKQKETAAFMKAIKDAEERGRTKRQGAPA